MAQYTINSKHASVLAMDTHARTVTVSGVALETGEAKTKRFNDCPSPEEIASWIQESFPAPHYSAYESGCTGFYLCRELNNSGIDCDVIAVSSIARSTDDKKRKSDRKDAKRLLHELVVPGTHLSKVWLPDEECEGVRDLLRSYRDAVCDLKRSKQRTTALLLRHGYVFNEKTPTGRAKKTWGRAFMKWVHTIDLGTEETNNTLAYYLSAVAECTERVARMATHIEKKAQEPRWKPYVDALCCISGVGVYSAMVYTAEIGDFSRFKNGRSVSMWAGITPKSHASGERQHANGRITKAGSAQVRCALVEGCSNYGHRKYAPIKLDAGQVVSEHIIAEANKCNRRLIERHRHLIEDLNKAANVAKIAIASEMIRWVWAIGCMVQREECAKAAK